MDEVVKLMFSIASVWNAPLGENMLRVSPDIALLVANFPSIRGGGLIVEACGTSWTGSSKYTSIRATVGYDNVFNSVHNPKSQVDIGTAYIAVHLLVPTLVFRIANNIT